MLLEARFGTIPGLNRVIFIVVYNISYQQHKNSAIVLYMVWLLPRCPAIFFCAGWLYGGHSTKPLFFGE